MLFQTISLLSKNAHDLKQKEWYDLDIIFAIFIMDINFVYVHRFQINLNLLEEPINQDHLLISVYTWRKTGSRNVY